MILAERIAYRNPHTYTHNRLLIFQPFNLSTPKQVLLKGAVHDPCLAAKLLELDEGDERVKVIIPTLDYNDPRTSARHPHLRRAARTASFRAISCLRAVAVLERALLEKGKGKGRQRAKHGIKALASDCENVDPASVCPEEGDEVAIANSKAMAKANINYMANAEEDRGSDSDLELRAEESLTARLEAPGSARGAS